MRQVVESYGYRQYDAPLLESFELYAAKTGEEIVERQLYDFIDKGDRHVAIRPEMTPSLARMVAARCKELPRPIRWFSLPNLWRYEAPGHGRLREHWQLNVDVFGENSFRAELEIIQLACDILFAFGAPKGSFRVKISHRRILSDFFEKELGLQEEKSQPLAKLLDKKNKLKAEEFDAELLKILDKPEEQKAKIERYLLADTKTINEFKGISAETLKELQELFSTLDALGLSEIVDFDPSIIRGFDYYTGFIFEIFDTDPKNRRSLYGGGRYDNLIGLFSKEELSGIGFGLGDVTLENFLRSHKLVPDLNRFKTVFIPLLDEKTFLDTIKLASSLRKAGIQTETMLNPGIKLGKQFGIAEKKGYKYILILGEDEIRQGKVQCKDLEKGEQNEYSMSEIVSVLQDKLKL